MSDSSSEGRPAKKKEEVRSQEYRIIYANTFALRVNDVEAALTFGIDGGAGPNSILAEASVYMTPRSLKILSHTLNHVIQNFENKNGPISVPVGKLERIEKNIQEQSNRPRNTPASDETL